MMMTVITYDSVLQKAEGPNQACDGNAIYDHLGPLVPNTILYGKRVYVINESLQHVSISVGGLQPRCFVQILDVDFSTTIQTYKLFITGKPGKVPSDFFFTIPSFIIK